jgi:hypothetical protein
MCRYGRRRVPRELRRESWKITVPHPRQMLPFLEVNHTEEEVHQYSADGIGKCCLLIVSIITTLQNDKVAQARSRL